MNMKRRMDAAAIETAALVQSIMPLMHGRDPGVQGGALCDLLAMWLAGHPDWMREDMLAFHMAMVLELTPVNERQLFGGHGHPQNAPQGGTTQ